MSAYGYELVRSVVVGEREVDGQRVPVEDRVERWPIRTNKGSYWIVLQDVSEGQARKARTFYSRKAAIQSFERIQRERSGAC